MRTSLKILLERERESTIRLMGTHNWFNAGEHLGWKDWLLARKAHILSDYLRDSWRGVQD